MKATELRIGNWVNITGQPVLIKDITYSPYIADNCRANNTPTDQIEPILLTPEILQQCGFIKVNELYDGTEVYKGMPYLYFKDGVGSVPASVIGIKSLHQLQNIYFALTGKELKVNLI